MINKNTIAAISTAPGIGGIAVIRVSGNEAITLSDSIFRAKKQTVSLLSQPTSSITFGDIIGTDNNTIDEVLISVFRAPHSFTGEDLVEISCHGSQFIQQEILRLLIDKGCRLAGPGEFTQRAFLNGKMDLAQAEAVADLIASTSQASHRMAMNQMRGGFSSKLAELRNQLLQFVSLIELELDFSEEDVEFADRKKLKALSANIQKHISDLANSFRVGNALKNGIPVALVGETNVGKSTLLNLLLKEEKAIVSNIHGTTRDTIEDIINVRGITFRFIDTAGIRKTTDTIESIGIERTFQKIEQASIVLWIIDSTKISKHMEWLTEKIEEKARSKEIIMIFNKIDKINNEEKEILHDLFSQFEAKKIFISAKQKININVLEDALIHAAHLPDIHNDNVVVSNIRHYEALQKALAAIKRVNKNLDTEISSEFLSQDIRECMFYLGEITGQISNDEILGNIFENFCIGK